LAFSLSSFPIIMLVGPAISEYHRYNKVDMQFIELSIPISAGVSILMATCGIVLGHINCSKVNKWPEQYSGKGLSIAGMFFGYLLLIWTLLGFFVLLTMCH
jgi:hypothetical protein